MPIGGRTSGSRRLLRQLRDVMAGAGDAQDRLNKVVRLIALEMVAEVCSAYLLRPGDVLELFATEGLKPEAVHLTRLGVGEGLVGEIAATGEVLALSDAQAHPNFAYRPETGEEIYQAFLGVPIQRGARAVGVLVVQNRTRRQYTDDEIEAMQTIAMVLAEMVGSGDLLSPTELSQARGVAALPARVEGAKLNGGLGMGEAVLHSPRIVIQQVVAEDPAAESERLEAAISAMQRQVDDMLAQMGEAGAGEHTEVMEAYRMFASDRGWLEKIRAGVQSGLTAEASAEKVARENRARMARVKDPYLRERMSDLDDLGNRLLQHLTGARGPAGDDLPDHTVVIARTLGPAELLDYDRSKLRALVLDESSANAHVAIVARALDVPVVGRTRDVVDQVDPGDRVVVDGDNAQVFLRPTEQIVEQVKRSIRIRKAFITASRKMRDAPSVTRDGVRVSLNLNVGLMADMTGLEDSGADGVGLYRTEIPFMVRSAFPSIAAQRDLYARALDMAHGRPVVFRLLDAGGDKRLPYWSDAKDENPALGWRAIRIGLDRPSILRNQLRALIQAAAGRPLRVLAPMIAEVAEFDAVRAIAELELDRARANGTPAPETFSLGAMIEVPSITHQLRHLTHRADFVAVGSNDLSQFFFASDRGNPKVSGRYDVLSPAMLSVLEAICSACRANETPLSLCGEMAGDPLEAMALIGIGFRTLSMTASAVGPVKAMLRSLDTRDLTPFMAHMMDVADHSVRARLRGFAGDHGVTLGDIPRDGPEHN